jgi:hypothetical protein
MGFRSKANGNLTEADKKFFALRDSGYKGPIDQNGNKVVDKDKKKS